MTVPQKHEPQRRRERRDSELGIPDLRFESSDSRSHVGCLKSQISNLKSQILCLLCALCVSAVSLLPARAQDARQRQDSAQRQPPADEPAIRFTPEMARAIARQYTQHMLLRRYEL